MILEYLPKAQQRTIRETVTASADNDYYIMELYDVIDSDNDDTRVKATSKANKYE